MMLPRVFGESLFDDLFDDFWDFPSLDDKAMRKAERKLYGHHAAKMMKTDVKDTEHGYEITMNLPGVKKEDVKAALKDGYLTISATSDSKKEEKNDKGQYIRRERYTGSCSRSFYVGEDVQQEDIKAEFKHGILKLFVPKKEAKPAVEEKKHIAIEG